MVRLRCGLCRVALARDERLAYYRVESGGAVPELSAVAHASRVQVWTASIRWPESVNVKLSVNSYASQRVACRPKCGSLVEIAVISAICNDFRREI